MKNATSYKSLACAVKGTPAPHRATHAFNCPIRQQSRKDWLAYRRERSLAMKKRNRRQESTCA